MIVPVRAPDPNPRRPKTSCPPGAVDTHVHIFGPTSRFPYVSDRGYTPPEASLRQLLAMHGTLGIERAVLVQPSVYGTDNGALLAAMKRAGTRARGVAVVAPDAPARLLHDLASAGVCAVRFNMHLRGGVPLEALEATAQRIASLDWHVQFFGKASDLVELAPRLAKLPTPIVIDHMGLPRADLGTDQAGFRALLDLLKGADCWVKLSAANRVSLSGPPYCDVAPYAQALIAAAPERCLWGSDWPHPWPHQAADQPTPNDGDIFDLLAEWAPDPGQRKAILVDNPARLFVFAQP